MVHIVFYNYKEYFCDAYKALYTIRLRLCFCLRSVSC